MARRESPFQTRQTDYLSPFSPNLCHHLVAHPVPLDFCWVFSLRHLWLKVWSNGSNSIVFQNSIRYINHSFSIPLQRPNYFINSVDKTKVLHVRPHHRRNTTVLFLRNLTLPSKSVFIWYHTTYLSESKHAMRMKIFNLNVWIYSHRGGSRIFLGGGALVSCSTEYQWY